MVEVNVTVHSRRRMGGRERTLHRKNKYTKGVFLRVLENSMAIELA